MSTRRFAHSFRRTVELKPEETCSLKHHYRGAMREVVGLIDLWASNDPERFVYAGVDAIVKHCRRYQQPKNKYGERWVKYALAALRARNIISKRLLRVRKGEKVEGFIVAPHEHLVLPITDGLCRLVGMSAPFNCWKQAIGPDDVPYGPVWWIAPAPGSAPGSAPHSAPGSAPHYLPQPYDIESAYVPNSGPNRDNRVSQSALVSKKLTTPLETGGQVMVVAKSNNNPNSKTGRADGKEENPRLIDETVGQHFGMQPVWVDIETACAGQMNLVVWEKVDGETRRNLLDCFNAAVEEFAAQPYRGHETNALLMDMAAKRFNKEHGEYPKCWLKVLNDLKRSTNTPLETMR